MQKKPMKRKAIISIFAIIMVTAILFAGIMPSRACILTATVYIKIHYPDRNFRYDFIEYSSAFGEYFVHFEDKDGKRIGLMTAPFIVLYDPLNPPC
jgi:hypothetical protein